MQGLIVVLWRSGLRNQRGAGSRRTRSRPKPGSLTVRRGKGEKRRIVGMDRGRGASRPAGWRSPLPTRAVRCSASCRGRPSAATSPRQRSGPGCATSSANSDTRTSPSRPSTCRRSHSGPPTVSDVSAETLPAARPRRGTGCQAICADLLRTRSRGTALATCSCLKRGSLISAPSEQASPFVISSQWSCRSRRWSAPRRRWARTPWGAANGGSVSRGGEHEQRSRGRMAQRCHRRMTRRVRGRRSDLRRTSRHDPLRRPGQR